MENTKMHKKTPFLTKNKSTLQEYLRIAKTPIYIPHASVINNRVDNKKNM